jgi:hypothetical protein
VEEADKWMSCITVNGLVERNDVRAAARRSDGTWHPRDDRRAPGSIESDPGDSVA